jgi:glutaredoxin 3
VAFTEYRAGDDPDKRREMIQRSHGGSTYPQIFINGRHVGGSDDIHDLDMQGSLDPLLAEVAAA